MIRTKLALPYLALTIICCLLMVAGCGKSSIPTPEPGEAKPTKSKSYKVFGKTYYPLSSAEGFSEAGVASWYGPKFHGRKTSNGEKYDMEAMTAAHKLLPFDTVVRVENLDNGKNTVVRINDRGPFVDGRVIDLSKAGARKLGMIGPGTANVRITALRQARPSGQPAKPGKLALGPFTVQVGAFTVESNAYRLAAKLRVKYGTVDVQRYDRGDKVFHRVRVGKESSLAKAKELRNRILTDGEKSAVVVAW